MAQHFALLNQIKSGGAHIAAGLAVGVSIVMVGNITGCNSFLATQAEQDVATSTLEPRINSIDSSELIEFKKQNAYANQKLAEMRLYAAGGNQ